VKLFIDENLPPALGPSLRALVEMDGDTVVHLRERYPAETSDEQWLDELSRDGGWAIFSLDRRIVRANAQRSAFGAQRNIGFFGDKGWKKLGRIEIIAHLLLWWPWIKLQSQTIAPGSGFVLPVKSTSKPKTL
jgi:hypothetical protein